MTDRCDATNCFDLVLADDDERVVDALADLLGDHPGFRVVGIAADGDVAATLCAQTHAQLAVLDVMMPCGGIDGLVAVTTASPETAVAFYTAKSDRRTRERLLGAGAVAVFAKGGSIDLATELYATAVEFCGSKLTGEASIDVGADATQPPAEPN